MRARVLGLLGVAVVLVVGLIDSMLTTSWDLVAVFALALILQVALVLRITFGRQPASLRGDLARWIDRRALATGDDPDLLLDRCVAAYRAGLTDVDAGHDDR